MGKRTVPLLAVLALTLVIGACGDDDGTAVQETVSTGSTSVFEATPGTLPDPLETIVVESDGESFELPAAVCLDADGDGEIVLAAAQQEASTLHSLFAHEVSGWPTTTAQPPDQQEIWLRDFRLAGISALTLARLAGEQATLEQTWVNYEQRLANPEEGWGPPDVISRRLDDWKAAAAALTDAIAAYCTG